jgi:hypothetical protein
MTNHPDPDPTPRKAYHQWMAAGSAFAKAVIQYSEREEPMNQVDGCCQHGELLDKYCPECAREDREAEDKEFKLKEGDRILVGWVEDEIDSERTYLYTDRAGRFVCVESTFEKEYQRGVDTYTVVAWPYAKPPLPKKLIPEERLKRIAQIILDVDNRCMAVDGPVTPTLEEMTQDEISEIWELSRIFR